MSFSTTVLSVVEDSVINRSNLELAKAFIEREARVDHQESCFLYGSRFVPNYPQEIHQDFAKLTGATLDSAALNRLIHKSNRLQSVNPTLEIEFALDRIQEHTPQNAAVILAIYDGVIIGSIFIQVDPRSTFKGETVGYFIGIRKSFAMIAAQFHLKETGSPLLTVKVSNLIVPTVEAYAKLHRAKYIITTPFINMREILQKYFGFGPTEENTIESSYEPPSFIMTVPEESINWKLI